MNTTNTFNTLKFGYFTANDIKQRWLTKDNSKFISLPIEIKLDWIDLLVKKYRSKVVDKEKSDFDQVIANWKKMINGEMDERDFATIITWSFFAFISFRFSLTYSFTIFSSFFSPVLLYSEHFTNEIMEELEEDAKLLNQVISEYDCLCHLT